MIDIDNNRDVNFEEEEENYNERNNQQIQQIYSPKTLDLD
jgi:hypothetical protein